MRYIVVFITTANKKESEKITEILLEKHIVACVNIIENIESHFWWEGKKEKSKEILLIAKTKKTLFKKLVTAVKSAHSYKVPEIIAIPVIAGYEPYLKWMEEIVL